MKKLFLYLSILYAAIFVFFVAFLVFRNYFSESSKDIVANTVEITTEETIDVIDYYSQPEYMEYSNIPSSDSGVAYRVGIKNGYVVVFTGKTDTVYEYTDISAEVLKYTDINMYNKIIDELEFNTQEEMFDFLESIAS